MKIIDPKPIEGEDDLFHYQFESYFDFICWFGEHKIHYRAIQTVDVGLSEKIE